MERICAQRRKQESARDTEQGENLGGSPGVARCRGRNRGRRGRGEKSESSLTVAVSGLTTAEDKAGEMAGSAERL